MRTGAASLLLSGWFAIAGSVGTGLVERQAVPGRPADGQAEAGQATTYIDAASLFPVRIQLPRDFDPARRYRLIVGLHGHGGRADEFFSPAPMFAEAGLIYAVPQAPYALPMAGRIGYSWNLRGVDDAAEDLGEIDLSMDSVLRVIDSLVDRYPVDEVYLMGFSQGGGLAYRTAIRHHRRFAGLMAFGTSLNPGWFTAEEMAAARGLRVFVGHGRADRVAERSTASHARLEELGFDSTLYDYEGGHTIARSAVAEMFRWLDGE